MTRKNIWQAPNLFVGFMQLMGIKSQWYATLAKVRFIPIQQYPPSVEVRACEVGAVVKMNARGGITKVVRRVIQPTKVDE